VIGCFQYRAIDVEEAARQSERVNLVRVDHLDGEWDLRVRVKNQILPDAIYVFGDQRVGDQFRLPVNLSGELSAEPDFLVERIKIELMFIDVALTDQLRVVVVG